MSRNFLKTKYPRAPNDTRITIPIAPLSTATILTTGLDPPSVGVAVGVVVGVVVGVGLDVAMGVVLNEVVVVADVVLLPIGGRYTEVY